MSKHHPARFVFGVLALMLAGPGASAGGSAGAGRTVLTCPATAVTVCSSLAMLGGARPGQARLRSRGAARKDRGGPLPPRVPLR